MNKAILMGRLTRDVELKTTASGVSVASFSIAVNRRFKNADGGYDADFINCVAWRQQAEFISKYFKKGSQIGVTGSIQTRNYEKDGKKVYVTEVAVDEAEFVGAKSDKKEEALPEMPSIPDNDGFVPAPADGDLPF